MPSAIDLWKSPPEAHKPRMVSDPGLLDQVHCACGWKSSPYFDGREWAMEDWVNHTKEEAGG